MLKNILAKIIRFYDKTVAFFKNRKNRPEKKHRLSYKTRRILWGFGLTAIFTCFFTLCTFLWYAFIYVDGVFDLSSLDQSLNYTTTMYGIDDGEIVPIESLHGAENRIWVSIDQIPKNLQHAFVAIEDERFYKHSGVDIKRTFHAVLNYFNPFSSKSFGGSTITQQLVKNLTTDDEKAITRKIQEMRRAWYLESQYNKDQILEVYLNTIYLSQGCNGVQTASAKYFDKDVTELTLAECACIAAITNAPTRYDPLQNPDNNKTRRNNILNKMVEVGYISKEECEAAKAEELVFKSGKAEASNSVKSYFVDAVTDAVIDDLVELKGYSKYYAESLIYSGGLKIYTTMDVDVQKAMDSVYQDESNFPKISTKDDKGNKVTPQSAMAIIDNKTGAVVALSGGIGEKKEARGQNRATQTYRQPGSSIKPLSTYAPAIEYGVSVDGNNALSPSSMILDWYIDEANEYPKNQSRYQSNQKVTLLAGVASSLNTVAARVNVALGEKRSLDFMIDNLGFTSIVTPEMNRSVNDQAVGALGLGGLTKGVNVVEMSSAYASFANDGEYTKPYLYTKVVDQNGRVIIENKVESHTAMSKETARVMNNLLTYAVTSGTGTPANFGSTEIAGKTGTTSEDYDRWFAGYTSYYSGVVWYGYDYPKTVVYGGQNPAAVTWKKVMSKVHNGLAYKSLNKPETLVECQYCFESGMLPSESCTMLEMGNFLPDGVPTAICDAHGTAAPPADTPTETPPADTPVETPPVETPPTETPPVETPPVETPPEEKPVETPDDEKQDDKQQQDEKEDDKKEPDNTEKPTE